MGTRDNMFQSSLAVVSAIIGVLAAKYVDLSSLSGTIEILILLMAYAFITITFADWIGRKVLKN